MAIAFAVCDRVSVAVGAWFCYVAVGYGLLTGEFVSHGLTASHESITNMAVETVQVRLQQAAIKFHLDMTACA